MSSDSPPAVGIDLGTTFSAVARLDDTGRPITLVNAEGDLVTPTVVLIDGPDIIVGKEAVKAMGAEAERIAECVKRDLGRMLYKRPIDGRQYPPEVLLAVVLKKLADDARRQIGDFSKVVVTVPAYFDEVRRKATQDAGYIAGLEVMDIINEPTAAAVAFGFQQGFLNVEGQATAPHKVLVYDLGGGTFDVTVMEIAGNKFTALATDGDVELGGRDWDSRIMEMVADQFKQQHQLDPMQDQNAAGRLWRDCEDAKRTLSVRDRATATCDFRGLALRMEITRETFEEITADLLDRTNFTTRKTLQAAGLEWDDIERVLIVGGSSRMPMVREMLHKLSGKEPDASVSADEAVAHGAALHAGILLAKAQGKTPRFRIKNVNSHSLGVVGSDRKTRRPRTAFLIPRNTPLPVVAKRTFKTQRAGQKSVVVRIVEGESLSPEGCTAIGKCQIKNLPKDLPKESPVDVEFRYDASGRLNVTVEVAASGQRVEQEIVRASGLTPHHLEKWREWLKGIGPT